MPTDERDRMVLRFAVGITLAMALSQGVAWRLSYMAPVLAMSLLAAPMPLPFAAGVRLVVVILGSMFFGWLLAALLLPYPAVCIIAISLLLFSVFHLAARGANAFLVLMLLIAVTMLPVVGQQSLGLVEEVAIGLAIAGAAAVLVQWLAFAAVPPPPGAAAAAKAAPAPDPETALRSALRATAVVLPLLLAYLVFGWTSLIVLVIAAMLAQQADPRAGATGLVLANLVGGATAIVAYNLLVVVPTFPFLLAVSFALALLFAERIFRDEPSAAMWSSAFSASLILVGSTITPFGGEAGDKFYQRLLQVMLGGVYVAVALAVLRRNVPGSEPAAAPAT